jgi:hypothetical protein
MAPGPPASFARGRSVEYGLGDRSVRVWLIHAEGIVESTPASHHAIATSFHIPYNSLITDRHPAVCVLTLRSVANRLHRSGSVAVWVTDMFEMYLRSVENDKRENRC